MLGALIGILVLISIGTTFLWLRDNRVFKERETKDKFEKILLRAYIRSYHKSDDEYKKIMSMFKSDFNHRWKKYKETGIWSGR